MGQLDGAQLAERCFGSPRGRAYALARQAWGVTPQRVKQARQWRAGRIRRFTEKQRRKHDWINFAEITDWCSEIDGSVAPNEAACASAYEKLQRDLLEGDFEENDGSRVLYLHPWTVMAKITRARLREAVDVYPPATVRSEYLNHCWIPRKLFQAWIAKHHLPQNPPRFAPALQTIGTEHASHAGAQFLVADSGGRKRGRRPIKLEQVKQAMRGDIQSGRQTDAGLRSMLEKSLAGTYGVSRDTARKARKAVLSEIVEKSQSRQITTNDK